MKSDAKLDRALTRGRENNMIISQIFSRALQSLKLATFMGSFYPKYKINELKIYRGVTYHGNEE